jgi:hypothetical protein
VDHLGGREEEIPASPNESAAVTAAIGLRHERAAKGSPLTKVESAATDFTESEFGSERLMKSPELQNLDSPELSGESAFGDDDGPSSPGSPGVNHQAPNLVVRRVTGEVE